MQIVQKKLEKDNLNGIKRVWASTTTTTRELSSEKNSNIIRIFIRHEHERSG